MRKPGLHEVVLVFCAIATQMGDENTIMMHYSEVGKVRVNAGGNDV